MRAAAALGVVVAVLIVGWWLWRYDPDPVRAPSPARSAIHADSAIASNAPPVATGSARRVPHVTRLTTEERAQTATRINDARKHHAATAPPRLPEGSATADDTMATAQQVLAQLQAVTDDIRSDVAACSKLPPDVKGFKTQITLTGDADIGTLIDAPSAGVADDGKPLPKAFDECVREHLQLLELPPIATGNAFTADFAITL